MTKLIAIICVVSWSGFWAFGYIAITSDLSDSGQMTIAAILAFAGMITGVFAYFKLAQHAEASGYSRPAGGAVAPHKNSGSEIA